MSRSDSLRRTSGQAVRVERARPRPDRWRPAPRSSDRVQWWALLLVATLLGAACTAPVSQSERSTPPAQATGPSDLPGKLIFTRGTALWAMDLGTGSTSEIVSAPELGQVTGARGSYDGQRVSYALYEVKDRRTPVSEIYLVGVDGSGRQKILEANQAAEFYQMPVWDPDGQHLYVLYTATTGVTRVRQIFRLDLTSGEREVVLEEAAVFDISPDGRWMALVRSNLGQQSISVMDLLSRQERVLVPEGRMAQITAPRFDPSSQTLAFSGTASETSHFDRPARRSGPLAWLSPATAFAHGLPQDVWTVAVSGGEVSKRLPMDADEPIAAWSPDGSHFAVLSFANLITIPSSGGSPTERLSPGSYGAIDWLR